MGRGGEGEGDGGGGEGEGGGSEGDGGGGLWEMTVAAITMAGLARATVPVGLARAALARARVEQAMEAAASEQSLSVSQACSTVICGTSTTSRVDSAPAWLSSGFCARASRSQMDLLRRRHLPAPRSGRKK